LIKLGVPAKKLLTLEFENYEYIYKYFPDYNEVMCDKIMHIIREKEYDEMGFHLCWGKYMNDEKKEELEWKALEKFLTYNILLPKEYPFVFTPQNIIVEKINNQKLRDKWMEESWYMVRDIVEKGLRERCDKYRYLQAFSVNGEELEASLLGQSIRRNIEVLEDKGIVKRIGEDGLFDLDHLLLTAKRFPLIVVHQSGLVYFLLCYDMNIPNIYEDKREDSFFKVVENIYKIQERMKTEKSSTLGTKVERPKQPEESRDTLNPYDLNNVQKVNRE